MEQIRSSGLEEQLAYHTAPVLMGIKPAGLFSVGQALGDTWKQIRAFHQKMAFSGLRIRILCSCKKRLLLFVYQEQRLEAALSPSILTSKKIWLPADPVFGRNAVGIGRTHSTVCNLST